MTVGMKSRPFSQSYLKVQCECGRRLRAAVERIGHSIHCWECRRPVPVPVPRVRGRSARVLSFGVREVFEPRALLGIGFGALAFTASLLLPVPEPVVAGLTLAALVFVYGELVRRWGLAGSLGAGAKAFDPRGLAARAAATLAVALVLTNAWEFGRERLGYTPGLFKEALAAAAALAFIFPLAMLAVWAAPHPRQSLAAIARHPVATAVALMVVPLGLVAGEAAVAVLTSLQGYFVYYVVDLLPGSGSLAERFGISLAGNYAMTLLPNENEVALYLYQLRHGVTLSAALPASVMDPSKAYLRPWALETSDTAYLIIRGFHTTIVAAVWFAALTVQARCLGLLARLWDWQQPLPFAPAPKADSSTFPALEAPAEEPEDAAEMLAVEAAV